MKEGCPSEPYVRLRAHLLHLDSVFEEVVLESALRNSPHFSLGYVVEHFKSVGEVLLMSLSVNTFHTLQLGKLRKDVVEKSGLVKELESDGRLRGDENLVQFLHYPFLRQDLHPLTVTGD